MPYQLTGILKLPDGTPAANVDIEFISQANYSPLVRDLSNTIRTSDTGSYSVELEYGEYAIRLLYASAYPLHPGKIYVYADTPVGQDLPTLMQAANWTPTTPDYIVQIQNWLVEANAARDGAMESAAEAKVSELAAKASETAVEADRAEVATNKAAVSASQADVATKQADVAAKASQVASDKAATEAAKTAAVSASTSASSSASSASGSASSAATSAANSESSALRAEAAAGSLVVEEIPFPDVWIPFSDSLVMLSGYGDEVKVGGYTVARMASFSRASGATYIDKSGVLRTAAVNEPRFEKEGLLIEGQSTNLVPYSEAYTSIPGITGSGRCTFSGVDGWYTWTMSDVSSPQWGEAIINAVPAGTITCSLNEVDWIGDAPPKIVIISRTASVETALFASTVLTEEMRNKRLSFTVTVPEGSTSIRLRMLASAIKPIGEIMRMRGLQIEALPFASSYIPTDGAAATRADDLCMLNTEMLPNTGNECTISAVVDSVDTRQTEAPRVFDCRLDVSSGTSFYGCLTYQSGTGRMRQACALSASSVYGLPVELGSYSLAFSRNESGEVSMSTNGNLTKTAPTSQHTPAKFTEFTVGRNTSGSRSIWGHIRNFRIWHRALTDNQLKSIR